MLLELGKTRMYLLLHLRYLLDLRSSPTVLPSLLSYPVETMAGPSETYFGLLKVMTMSKSFRDTKPDLFTDSSMLLVDQVGVEPTSEIPSL